MGLVAAAAVLVAIVGWTVLAKLGVPLGQGVIAWAVGWEQASLDLRGHEALRGAEPGPPLPPLILPRGKLIMTIDLPVGSEPGNYEVELRQPNGQPVARARGTANLVNGLTVLKIRIDARKTSAWPCSLAVRKVGESWASYSVVSR